MANVYFAAHTETLRRALKMAQPDGIGAIVECGTTEGMIGSANYMLENGGCDAYIAVYSNPDATPAVYFCGKDGGKSHTLAVAVAQALGDIVLQDGDGLPEIDKTTMTSVVVELGSGMDMDTAVTGLWQGFAAWSGIAAGNPDAPVTEAPNTDRPTTDVAEITDAELGAAVRTLLRAFRG